MQKNVYEILDEFKAATTRQAKINVLRTNDSKILRDALYLTFSPNIRFYTIDFPRQYIPDRDNPPEGMGWSHFGIELRRMYLFMENHPGSKHLTKEKRDQLLIELLESLEPREAEIVIAMFRKNLPAVDLTLDLVREAFPTLGI